MPVSLIAGTPFLLTVNPTLPVHSVADLVALAKKRSAEGKPLTYGSGGVGAFHHLCAALFSSLTGITMTHVPYRGSAPATMALISRRDRRAVRRPRADVATDQGRQGPCSRHHQR